VRNTQGEIYRLAGVTKDITESKAAEMALRESEERFRQLAENVHSVFWLIEADTQELMYISPAYETIWGRTCMSMYADPHSFIDSIHPEDRESMILERQEKLLSGDYNVEYRILRPDSTVRWVNSRAYRVFDEHGSLRRIAGVTDDITERKAFEHQTLELALEREQIRLLADFIRDTSHDLRTPLTVINNCLYLLKRSGDFPKHGERFLMMENQIMHINRLIADLHSMSELDTAAVQPELTLININVSIETARQKFDEQAQAKSQQVIFAKNMQIPDIEADSYHLERAIGNLLHNAILYTPDGGKITIDASASAAEIIISIHDTGIGIEAEHLPYIFDRFYKVDSSRTSGNGGHGLGLTMVKKIMEMHGGEVNVETAPGRGSTFWLRLPLNRSTT
jgi:PAS domain S-box-containing protein